MKVRIETREGGRIRIFVETDSCKKPIDVELTQGEASAIASAIGTAARATAFVFQLEI